MRLNILAKRWKTCLVLGKNLTWIIFKPSQANSCQVGGQRIPTQQAKLKNWLELAQVGSTVWPGRKRSTAMLVKSYRILGFPLDNNNTFKFLVPPPYNAVSAGGLCSSSGTLQGGLKKGKGGGQGWGQGGGGVQGATFLVEAGIQKQGAFDQNCFCPGREWPRHCGKSCLPPLCSVEFDISPDVLAYKLYIDTSNGDALKEIRV